ncbi:MAG: hypothetical protein N2235_02500 [Fischerella sp.]|nr:hypothetical protein [Fischerella sp.]
MAFKPDTPEELIKERDEVLKAIFPIISTLNSAGVSEMGMAAGLIHAANMLLVSLDKNTRFDLVELFMEASDITIQKHKP